MICKWKICLWSKVQAVKKNFVEFCIVFDTIYTIQRIDGALK